VLKVYVHYLHGSEAVVDDGPVDAVKHVFEEPALARDAIIVEVDVLPEIDGKHRRH